MDTSDFDNAAVDENCQWQTYYVNSPIIDLNLFFKGSERESFRSNGCKNRVIPRYDA